MPGPVPAVPGLRPDHLQVPDPQGDQEEGGRALRRHAAQGGHLQAVRHTVDLRYRWVITYCVHTTIEGDPLGQHDIVVHQ